MFGQNYHTVNPEYTYTTSHVVHGNLNNNFRGLYKPAAVYGQVCVLILSVCMWIQDRNNGRQKLSKHHYIVVLLLDPLRTSRCINLQSDKAETARAWTLGNNRCCCMASQKKKLYLQYGIVLSQYITSYETWKYILEV